MESKTASTHPHCSDAATEQKGRHVSHQSRQDHLVKHCLHSVLLACPMSRRWHHVARYPPGPGQTATNLTAARHWPVRKWLKEIDGSSTRKTWIFQSNRCRYVQKNNFNTSGSQFISKVLFWWMRKAVVLKNSCLLYTTNYVASTIKTLKRHMFI